MNDNKTLKAMEIAIKFMDKLTDSQLNDIANGNLKFTIIENKKKNSSKVNKINLKEEDLKKIKNASSIIRGFKDRGQASDYITSLSFTKEKLLYLGDELGLRIPKSYTKGKMIEIIVEDIVGNKLKIEGLRKGIMGKSYIK